MSGHDVVTCALVWLAIGGAVWVLLDPFAYLDFVVRRYAQRNGRLPGWGMLALSVVVAIVLWPKAVLAVIERVRG